MTPTGGNSPPGCAATVSMSRRPTPQPSGSISPRRPRPATSVATLERRLSGICWRYRQLGTPLDASDRHIATVLAGIRRNHGRPPVQKAAIFADELLAMLATLDMDLRGLRDRAILALGFAGGATPLRDRRPRLRPRPERGRDWLDRDFHREAPA